jgi:arylsulfate sulfotransferase
MTWTGRDTQNRRPPSQNPTRLPPRPVFSATRANGLTCLGQQCGDFAVQSSDPYPWFSHQHDAEYELNGTQVLSLFDNGNTRRALGLGRNSRGQVWNIDEVNRVATLSLNADLGVYAGGFGSAQRLTNGNYHFLAGYLPQVNGSIWGQSIEVLPSGLITFDLADQNASYRSWRMESLYNLPEP